MPVREGKALVRRAAQTAPIWEECWLSLSATRLDCYGPDGTGAADRELIGSVLFGSCSFNDVDEEVAEIDVGIASRRAMLELLPDHARSSRHNTIFPFYVGPPQQPEDPDRDKDAGVYQTIYDHLVYLIIE